MGFKQFTTRDMNSRWDVVEVYRCATAGNFWKYLETSIERAHFSIRGIQVDRGYKFIAQFEQACAEEKIRSFVVPRRFPKHNGHVERAQRTYSGELYELYMGELDSESVDVTFQEWEHFYNTVHPHHSHDLRSPGKYLDENYSELA
ncbi:MAG: integrase core domain-containing protein [Anaerolineales bacterium]|jgi:transposase InsO family protein